jgi:hypothetical protein
MVDQIDELIVTQLLFRDGSRYLGIYVDTVPRYLGSRQSSVT